MTFDISDSVQVNLWDDRGSDRYKRYHGKIGTIIKAEFAGGNLYYYVLIDGCQVDFWAYNLEVSEPQLKFPFMGDKNEQGKVSSR